jgi:predicted nucleic acid-binding protein
MSVEPGILDANVLAYAVNADAPQHAAGSGKRPVDNALRYITNTLRALFGNHQPAPALPGLRVLPIPARAVEGWMELLRRHPVTGGDVFDLQIVATMQANGVHRIYTFNTNDFKMFPEFTAVTP